MSEHDNLIKQYERQAEELEQLLAVLSAECVSWRPAVDRWSLTEIAGHLADAELLASVRIRRILTQDRPQLFGYQQELWATRLTYQRRRIATVAQRFALLRRENAELLAEQTRADIWQQTGAHDEYGVVTLQHLIQDYVSHTAKHLLQMRAVAEAYRRQSN